MKIGWNANIYYQNNALNNVIYLCILPALLLDYVQHTTIEILTLLFNIRHVNNSQTWSQTISNTHNIAFNRWIKVISGFWWWASTPTQQKHNTLKLNIIPLLSNIPHVNEIKAWSQTTLDTHNVAFNDLFNGIYGVCRWAPRTMSGAYRYVMVQFAAVVSRYRPNRFKESQINLTHSTSRSNIWEITHILKTKYVTMLL